jgi:hypothetical protein
MSQKSASGRRFILLRDDVERGGRWRRYSARCISCTSSLRARVRLPASLDEPV